MKNQKENEEKVIAYIQRITNLTGQFIMTNHTIACNTELSESKVAATIKELVAAGVIKRTMKARITERGYSGTIRKITLQNELQNN